ncbi:sulfite exporter TauE/SafE family protein [Varunaivibrio sulfuroxidans]|uniref:Urease accessory protein UreH-like transmembrane domain-containing protein n=1 Tax=Varunaivibrio sulfuroxidans TaxID=1773489 RepID=A0A4R3JDJ6_9PROT|nr:sulfite exporter TauE/SafE family protein [Varunaivibrio sulfuroxidans]TCS64088.1 hypothetical protein EDD55_102127 [Varunaivibrio sulfuroxidans]WES31462.1 sulfite exporter TauE/SafE family protein [Varunaivibrio sulfuroxidans]
MSQEYMLANILASGLSECKVVVSQHGAAIGTLFVAGLAGSATHCAGMCGPFVVSQVSSRLEGVPASSMTEFHRLSGGALIPYHLGRMTTYAILGAAVAFLSGGVVRLSDYGELGAIFLAFAGLFFLGYALKSLNLHWILPRFGVQGGAKTENGGEGPIARLIAKGVKPLFIRPIGIRGYLLGVFLGLLPCGLLYGALSAAASTGNWLAGAFMMGAFALGTVPMLLLIGFAGRVAVNRWRIFSSTVAPLLMAFNAGFLFYLAWRMAF